MFIKSRKQARIFSEVRKQARMFPEVGKQARMFAGVGKQALKPGEQRKQARKPVNRRSALVFKHGGWENRHSVRKTVLEGQKTGTCAMYVLGPVLRTVIGRRLLDKQAQQLTVSCSEDMYRVSQVRPRLSLGHVG